MGYWEYDSRDYICSDFLPVDVGIGTPHLYISSIDSADIQNRYVFIETIHLKTDADFIWLLDTDFGSNWPDSITKKHFVIHTNRWMESWNDGVSKFPGVETEIIRSAYKNISNLPVSSAPQKLPPVIDLLDFNVLLSPGKGILLAPNKNGASLYFTIKLYKFAIYSREEYEYIKSKLVKLIEKVDGTIMPKANLLLDLISIIDKKLDKNDMQTLKDCMQMMHLLLTIIAEVAV